VCLILTLIRSRFITGGEALSIASPPRLGRIMVTPNISKSWFDKAGKRTFLLLSVIIMLPATVRAEWAVLVYGKANQLFEEIQDLELVQRNIEECYQSEKGTLRVESFGRQSWGEPAELDGKLINRVCGRLAEAPAYKGFVKAHWALIQRPDYRRRHTDELFTEYMRLLESGRIRFLTQLKEGQERLVENGSIFDKEGS